MVVTVCYVRAPRPGARGRAGRTGLPAAGAAAVLATEWRHLRGALRRA